MSRRFLLVPAIILGGQFFAAPVFAEQSNQVSVTAEILPTRYIYLDKSGNVQKVASNTLEDVQPTVVGQSNLSDKIANEYQAILSANGGRLGTGYYYPAQNTAYAQLARWLNSNPYFSQKLY